jgi:hypothetical protein
MITSISLFSITLLISTIKILRIRKTSRFTKVETAIDQANKSFQIKNMNFIKYMITQEIPKLVTIGFIVFLILILKDTDFYKISLADWLIISFSFLLISFGFGFIKYRNLKI